MKSTDTQTKLQAHSPPDKSTLLLSNESPPHPHKYQQTEVVRPLNPELIESVVRLTALKRIVDANERYLTQKVKIAEVPKPAQYSHKMPSVPSSSEYSRQYKQSQTIFENAEKSRVFNGIKPASCSITNYQTTYHQEYPTKASQSKTAGDLKDNHSAVAKSTAPNRKYMPSNAPTFMATSNQLAYPWSVQAPPQSAKRKEMPLMGEGRFKGESTYSHNYRLKTAGSQVNKPIVHSDHQVFMKIDKPISTNYQDAFDAKAGRPSKSCKPVQKYQKKASQMKYQTEYNDEFVSQHPARKQDFSYLSNQELKDFVMKVISK